MSWFDGLIRRCVNRRCMYTAAAVAAFGITGLVGTAGSAVAHRAGYVVIDSCTGVSGTAQYSPGLLKTTKRKVQVVLSSTTSGCSDIFNGPESGTGTFTAVLSGKASLASQNYTGTFTINWPASSGFNPSNGTLTISESGGLENVTGTVTSGFDTGTAFALQYATTGNTGKGTRRHPVKAQTFTNTQPLTLSRNEG